MERYSVINEKDKREIVLLKSFPCKWGRCSFCDYIDDNTVSIEEIIETNKAVLQSVTGRYKKLEVINSASVFELPIETLEDIRFVCEQQDIKNLVFEAYHNYRHTLEEIRNFFEGIDVEFKCGIESFDEDFRNNFLKKGIKFKDAKEVSEYFSTICLLVGIEGQTMDIIRKDMEESRLFDRVCINIFVENTTDIKADAKLIIQFKEEYGHLEMEDKYDILWNNTDFGVGGEESE